MAAEDVAAGGAAHIRDVDEANARSLLQQFACHALDTERAGGCKAQLAGVLAGGGIGALDLEDQDSGDTVTYQIVGEDEADIKVGKISVNSPMARALIGKYAGDIAQVQAPGGLREYEIIDVRYE